MGKFSFLVFLLLAAPAKAASVIPYYGDRFYQALEGGVSGEKLLAIVREPLLSDHRRRTGTNDELLASCSGTDCYRHTSVGYNRARVFLFGEFYLVKDGAQYGVREMYCNRIYRASEFRSTKPAPGVIPDGSVINAEHTWPQSKFTTRFSKDQQKSDLHHLFPTDSQLNSSRSSLPFGEVERNDKALKCPESRLGGDDSNDLVFEPPPAHKGNVARALFYFATRYGMKIDAEQEVNLRAWHEEDPVDEDERRRNEEIFKLQKNRNPFIDFPELVARISDF